MTAYVCHQLTGQLWPEQPNYSVRWRTQRNLNESLKQRVRTGHHLWLNRYARSTRRAFEHRNAPWSVRWRTNQYIVDVNWSDLLFGAK